MNGMVMTLPLSFGERRKFVTYSSIWWSRSERKSAIGSLIFLFLAVIVLIGIVISDYGIYYVLNITAPAFCSGFGEKGGVTQGAFTDSVEDSVLEMGQSMDDKKVPDIKGNSSMASMSRAFLSLANPLKDIAFDVDATLCRPKASKPNDRMNILVLVIIGFTVISIIFQVNLVPNLIIILS